MSNSIKFTVHYADDKKVTFYGSSFKFEDRILLIERRCGGKFFIPIENVSYVEVKK